MITSQTFTLDASNWLLLLKGRKNIELFAKHRTFAAENFDSFNVGKDVLWFCWQGMWNEL